MATIRLTDATWLKREADFWEGTLTVRLGKEGTDQDVILHWLSDLNKTYTGAEMLQIRDELVARGTIEVV